MSSLSSNHDPFAALRYREFRYLVVGTFLLTMSLMIQEVAIGYELYRLTRDPLSLGLVGLVEAIPFIALTLLGGHVADRRSKRTILLLSSSGVFVTSLGLQCVARYSAAISQTGFLICVYLSIFLIGICRAFFSPTSTALRAILVPPHLYENASTWGSTAWQVGAVLGPAFAGFLYAWVGFVNTLLAVTLGVLLVVWSYSHIYDKPIERKEEEDVWKSVRKGVQFVFRTKIILYAISLDLFSVLFGGVMAILPVYAQDVLVVGSEGLGILRAAPSLGAIVMLVILTRYSVMKHAWRNLLLAVTGFGVCILVFAVSKSMLLSVVVLFLSGASDSISVVIRATILQTMTPDKLRARVMAVNGIFLASSNELGAFESGLAARIMGTIPSVIFGGMMTLLIVAGVYARTKDLFGVTISPKGKNEPAISQ